LARHTAEGNGRTADGPLCVWDVDKLREAGPDIDVYADALSAEAENPDEFFIPDTGQKLARAAEILQERINNRHMDNGVVLLHPAFTYIGPHVTIGAGTTVYPGVFLEGATTIGSHCTIGPHSRLVNARLSEYVRVDSSVILDSSAGDFAEIGPFAHIRLNTSLGSHCKIGDFVEIKNSVVGENTKARHLSYIGDAQVGRNVNFGCGTITVNYDGKTKSATVVDDGAFIGCNANLIAPVRVAEGAYVAAGTTVTEDVPAHALGIGRVRQENKINWKKPQER